MNKLNISLFFLLILLLPLLGSAQEMDARNGWGIAPYGPMHVLVIFAEIDFDSSYGHLDPTPKAGTKDWKPGKLPWWKDVLFDETADKPAYRGYMTKYFDQASFGKFQVTGDYLDTMISIPISEVRDSRGRVVTNDHYGDTRFRGEVVKRVNEMPFETKYGSEFSDFDTWTLTSPGKTKPMDANQKWDMVMIIWRNIHARHLKDNSGFVKPGNIGTLHGHGSDSYSMFRMSNFVPKTIMRHEFSHMLYGGNNFHTAASGVGQRTFLCPVGGWSNMSNAGRCSPTWNAWDRHRMGWQNPDNQFLISARCAGTSREVNGDLSYGAPQACGEEYVLRDFISSGDAIRIELPHLPGEKRRQYLWLENHQILPGKLDHDKAMGPGLYAFITVGKDKLTGDKVYSNPNNYSSPLVADGNYDFGFGKDHTLIMDSDKQNKFTGYHYLARVAQDLNGNGRIQTASMGKNIEAFEAWKLSRDGEMLGEDYFSYRTMPIFGTKGIAFRSGGNSRIGMDDNPSPVPLLTWVTPGGKPVKSDTRRIYLNGLSIEIVREDSLGNLTLRVRWDDFSLRRDARWCGDILLTEAMDLRGGTTISLEQGKSVVEPMKVQEVGDEVLFAPPTLLELASGSNIRVRGNAKLVVRPGSGLLIRKGASVRLDRNAEIVVEAGGFLFVEEGAEISTKGRKSGFVLNSELMALPPHYGESVQTGPAATKIPLRRK